jgi:hypothetical protein
MDDLFRTENPEIEIITNMTLFMFVDDGKLFVSSDSLNKNIKALTHAYNITQEWLYGVGLAPDIDKRELMHYTRQHKDESPAIHLLDQDGVTRTITTAASVRWLGIHLDRKLSFDYHIQVMKTKAEVVVNGLTMLSNSV